MKRKVIITSIIIVEIIMIGIIAIPKKEDTQLLKEVKVIDKKDNNSLAIMLKGKEDTEYKKSEEETWPTETYMYSGTSCIDNTGKQIGNPGIVSFDNTTHTATITTKDTVYCYLYFAEPNDVIELVSKSPNLENAEDVSARGDVLRRFQGTAEKVNDNYICFGTNNPDDCMNHQDQYLYRIIGYTENEDSETNTQTGQLKLIKKEALEEGMRWHNINSDVNFGKAEIHTKHLNEQYWGLEKYVPKNWKGKIAEHTWWLGTILDRINSGNQQGEKVFAIENGKELTEYYEYTPDDTGKQTATTQSDKLIHYNIITNQKWIEKVTMEVGLINLSDYYLSAGKEINCMKQTAECKAGWMHLSNNDTEAPSEQEWMMTYYGYNIFYDTYMAFSVAPDGLSIAWGRSSLYSARPVIYTIAGLRVIGDGTLNNPYVITN